MAAHLPGYFAEILWTSSNTFAQPIYTVEVEENAVGRIALMGDAGAIAPPFTGSGVFKAMTNALDLADELKKDADPDSALRAWSLEQAGRGKRLAALGRQMEDAFVWNAPDFSAMTEQDARAWWDASISFPEEFNYVSD